MLFRTITGELVEINKYNFKNDKIYYEKIMEVMKPFTKVLLVEEKSAKLEKTFHYKNK